MAATKKKAPQKPQNASGKKKPVGKGKEATRQENLPGAEQKAPEPMPLKLRAQQMAKQSGEYLELLKERATIEEQQGKLREKKKKVQGRLDELAYQLAFAIKDPQLRLDEMADALSKGKA